MAVGAVAVAMMIRQVMMICWQYCVVAIATVVGHKSCTYLIISQ